MIYAGVDIAKADHVVGAVGETGDEVAKPMPFKNSKEGFERCVAWLEGVAETQDDVVIGMEATGHYWQACFSYLTSCGYRVAVINPMQVKAVRRLKSLSKVKNDRIDSVVIAETLRIGNFDETALATDELQSLKTLTRYRQSLKEQVAAVKTHVVCLMDTYFPEYDGIFSNMFGKASLAVLAKCPLPADIARVRESTLEKIVTEASHGRSGARQAAKIKERAKASIGFTLGSEAASFEIRSYISQIGFLLDRVAEADARIAALLEAIEPLVLTVPGISTTTGAQIVAEIGDVSRFKNAAAIVSYAGISSSVNQSGKFELEGGSITKHGSPYLRRALYLAAQGAYRLDPGLRAFYDKKRSEGKCHRVAVMAVARKLCHIIYAILRDQAPFESRG